MSRREFLRLGVRFLGIAAAGFAGSRLLERNGTVWEAPCSGKLCGSCSAGSICDSYEPEADKGDRDV
jgi:hypothetical protein